MAKNTVDDGNRPKFSELNFGEIDAAQEAISDPELLLNGYFDYREAAYGIETRHLWLLLGPKGSGKTAVLEHIRLKWKSDPNRFFTLWDLSGFPVKDVTEIATGQSKGASKTQAAWEFILLLRLLSSLALDAGLTIAHPRVERMISGLQRQGYITNDWVSAVTRWSLNSIKWDVKLLGGDLSRASGGTVGRNPLEMTAFMKETLATAPSESRHLIALDGLDSFFFETPDEWNSLTGLLQAINSLNKWSKEHGLPYLFVTAVRSDIFDVLSGPDLNKMKQNAVHLDWNAGGIGPQNQLWELVQMKASVGRPGINVIKQYFGENMVWIYPNIPTLILDHTRLLPRDVIAALNFMKLEYRGRSSIPEDNAKNAIKRYCSEYFVGEIFDNLAGVLPANKAKSLRSFQEALRTSPTHTFGFDYLQQELGDELESSEIRLLLKQMFDTGGLGIRNGKNTDFAYRNVNGAGFSRRHNYILHDALTRAWNRPWR